MENGRPPSMPLPEKDGGLTRVNGLAVIRRRERMPIRLLFGDLPATAGAESTCRGVGAVTGPIGVVGVSFNLCRWDKVGAGPD